MFSRSQRFLHGDALDWALFSGEKKTKAGYFVILASANRDTGEYVASLWEYKKGLLFWGWEVLKIVIKIPEDRIHETIKHLQEYKDNIIENRKKYDSRKRLNI